MYKDLQNRVVEAARSSGVPCILLPSDSDDYNPMKRAETAIKMEILSASESLGEAEDKSDVETILHYLVYDLAELHAELWFPACGYA
ncbi:hypothetical protein BDV93DRAFT_561994 [Ceratobasidium sp. AG-I]|nr:hypothetical protein BDV93DRAFT_561994 [Ceratobasidium sp. AG-I]